MPRSRRWDDPWQKYPASVPLPADGGIATTKQRGSMAASWWSQRLVELLASYGLGARMQRGRRYARKGQLVSFDVQLGVVVAQVQGSRRTPYVVTVAAQPLNDAQWDAVEHSMRSRAAFAARLLAGDVPPELEAVFAAVGVDLLPARWRDVRATCSCPDWESPCKHVAAVLYVFADRLDSDPWLLLTWRGRTREQLLGHLRAAAPDAAAAIARWWPLVPGAGLAQRGGERDPELPAAPPTDPVAVLRRCEPLAVDVRGEPVADLLIPAYRALHVEHRPAARTWNQESHTR
jgi:uncharacterized Zn finger protein